jgi:hypothetical protein
MPKTETEMDLEAEEFSARLIGVLKGIVRVHNKEQKEKKVNSSQLKQVYLNAADNYTYAGYSRGEWALARVNMFLRVLSGGKPDIVTHNKRELIGGVHFIAKTIEVKEELDISTSWTPSQEDFTKAKNDIKENELFFNFKSSDELYLENYKQIELKTY